MPIENLFIQGNINASLVEKFADKLLTIPRLVLFPRFTSIHEGKKISVMAFTDQTVNIGRNVNPDGSVKHKKPTGSTSTDDTDIAMHIIHILIPPLIITSGLAAGIGLCLKKHVLSKKSDAKSYNTLVKNYADIEKNSESLAFSVHNPKNKHRPFFNDVRQQKVLLASLESNAKTYWEQTSLKTNAKNTPGAPKTPFRVFHDFLTTPLHLAIQANNLSASRLIQSKAYNLNAPCSQGNTPLHYALLANRSDLIKELVANGASVNSPINAQNTFPLHFALQNRNQQQTLETLLECGANPNQQNKLGITPLRKAIGFDNQKGIKTLILNGADVNQADKLGNTPLHYAVRHNNKRIIALLLVNGADIDKKNNEGMTPLMRSVIAGNPSTTSFLISKKASLTTWDHNKNTLLHAAARRGDYCTFKKVCQGFHENGIALPLSIQNRHGNTALHLAIGRKKRAIVKNLLKNGANKQIMNENGLTPADLIFNDYEKK